MTMEADPRGISIGDYAIIDGDRALIGRVTRVMYSANGIEYELGWMHGGTSQSAWFPSWRIVKTGVPQQ